MGQKRRAEREFAKDLAKIKGITVKQAKKKYVTRAKDMEFLFD